MVIALDPTSFFARVTPGRIFVVLRRVGYPEATAYALTGLCTHAVPEAVLRSMPDGGTAEERFGLTHALRPRTCRRVRRRRPRSRISRCGDSIRG